MRDDGGEKWERMGWLYKNERKMKELLKKKEFEGASAPPLLMNSCFCSCCRISNTQTQAHVHTRVLTMYGIYLLYIFMAETTFQ